MTHLANSRGSLASTCQPTRTPNCVNYLPHAVASNRLTLVLLTLVMPRYKCHGARKLGIEIDQEELGWFGADLASSSNGHAKRRSNAAFLSLRLPALRPVMLSKEFV